MADRRCILVGAAKCGSTSLTAMLDAHPQVSMVPHEVHYFSYDDHFARGAAWYEALFDPSVPVIGENSNTYTMTARWPDAPERLIEHHLDGAFDPRIVYLVRHPLVRIESMWIEKRTHGGDLVDPDFNRSVRTDTAWLLDPSRYHHQLAPYLDAFGPDRVHVVCAEHLRSDPDVVLGELWRHLGVDPFTVPHGVASGRRNPSSTKQPETATLSRLRRVPGWSQAKDLVPPAARRAVKRRFFRRRLVGRPEWDGATRRWAAERLRDDAVAVLDLAGIDRSVWFDEAGEL